jgi:hypothetical protein
VMNSARTCGARFEEEAATGGGAPAMELLTIAPPTGGTIVAEGIQCGTQGKQCSSNRPHGSQLKLVAWADKGFTFQRFTGDCTQSGDANMLAPRTCGGIFVPSGATANLGNGTNPGGAKPPGTGGTRGSSTGNTGGTTAGGGAASGGTTGAGAGGGGVIAGGGGVSGGTTPGGVSGGRGGVDPSGGVAPPPPETKPTNDGPVAPPPPPPPPAMAEIAKKDIEQLLERYRVAYEARNFDEVKRAFPNAPAAIREQFKQIKSMKYDYAGAPKYVQLDAFNGTAVIEIGSTQTTEMGMGKRPPINWVERMDLQKRGADNTWVINSVTRSQKN